MVLFQNTTVSSYAKIKELLTRSDEVEEFAYLLNGSPHMALFVGSLMLENTNNTALMYAAKLGRRKCCQYLISLDPAAVNVANNKGFIALHYACYYGHNDVAFDLIRLGSDINKRNHLDETPLQSASMGLNFGLVALLKASVYCPNEKTTANSEEVMYKNIIDNHVQHFNGTQGSVSVADAILVPLPIARASSDGIDASVQQLSPTSERDASKFKIQIIKCDEGSLVGQSFNCLANFLDGTNMGSASCSNGVNSIVDSSVTYSQLMLGRSRSNHVYLPDLSVSKSHAVIVFQSGIGLTLWDCGSKHGSFLLGEESIPVPHIDNCRNEMFSMKTQMKTNSQSTMVNLLVNGTEFQLGRIHFKVLRDRQSATIERKFEPIATSNVKQSHEAGSTVGLLHSLNNISEVEYHKRLINGAYAQKILEQELDKKRKRDEVTSFKAEKMKQLSELYLLSKK